MGNRTLSLAFDSAGTHGGRIRLGAQAFVLPDFAEPQTRTLLDAIDDVCRTAPLRHMVTPGGRKMSVSMTNCGAAGWVSDARGYRYDAIDPLSRRHWPAMPAVFEKLATAAADAAGFPGFSPDACLINQYLPGTRLTLHQDRDERDFSQPIVSVSLGVSAVFLWCGQNRSDRALKVALNHGDVAVWGGVDRLTFHGIAPLEEARHPMTGSVRYNLTFRKAR